MMIANEINNKFEMGILRICDGWDGIKSGMVRVRSITLSEMHDDAQQNCAC